MQLITTQVILPQSLSIDGEIEQVRNELALQAISIKQIISADQNNEAAAIARSIRLHLKECETSRVEFTKPLLDLQRIAKAVVDTHIQPLKDELARLEGLGTNWMLAERRRVAAEEQQRQESYHKAEAARLEAERKAQAATARAKTEAGEDLAVKAVDKANAAAIKVQEIIAAPMPSTQRAKGQSVKQELCWEVTDIHALAAARPDLVRMEPNAAGIKSTCVPNMPNLPPGLRLWWEDKATFTTK